LSGSSTEVPFWNLIPLGHTHTGVDRTVAPSTADLNEFARKKVKEHWLFSTDEGWARIRYDAKTRSFDILRNVGADAVRFTVFRNPDFNPRDRSPVGQSMRWRQSVGDVKGQFKVDPSQPREFGPPAQPPGSIWSRWVSRLMFGSVAAVGAFVMVNRYAKAIESDAVTKSGGTNTLSLLESDMRTAAIAHGIASLGPGPRRAVGAAGGAFLAIEVSKLLFGTDDDTLRQDPVTGREIRWIYKPVPTVPGMSVGTIHVRDSKTGQWAPAREYCSGIQSTCPYLTEREIQEVSDPWR
jgi:hypothetical protein